jgi:hypothetical protein
MYERVKDEDNGVRKRDSPVFQQSVSSIQVLSNSQTRNSGVQVIRDELRGNRMLYKWGTTRQQERENAK